MDTAWGIFIGSVSVSSVFGAMSIMRAAMHLDRLAGAAEKLAAETERRNRYIEGKR